jgi:hypothetical protein
VGGLEGFGDELKSWLRLHGGFCAKDITGANGKWKIENRNWQRQDSLTQVGGLDRRSIGENGEGIGNWEDEIPPGGGHSVAEVARKQEKRAPAAAGALSGERLYLKTDYFAKLDTASASEL